MSREIVFQSNLLVISARSRYFHGVASSCVCSRLEIEAQEQALEQLEKGSQEATRRAHDAEQKAKSALDTLKVCLSPLQAMRNVTRTLVDTKTQPGILLASRFSAERCSHFFCRHKGRLKKSRNCSFSY